MFIDTWTEAQPAMPSATLTAVAPGPNQPHAGTTACQLRLVSRHRRCSPSSGYSRISSSPTCETSTLKAILIPCLATKELKSSTAFSSVTLIGEHTPPRSVAHPDDTRGDEGHMESVGILWTLLEPEEWVHLCTCQLIRLGQLDSICSRLFGPKCRMLSQPRKPTIEMF